MTNTNYTVNWLEYEAEMSFDIHWCHNHGVAVNEAPADMPPPPKALRADVRLGIFDSKGRELGAQLYVEYFYKSVMKYEKGSAVALVYDYSTVTVRIALKHSRDGKIFGNGGWCNERDVDAIELSRSKTAIDIAAKADCERKLETLFNKVVRKAAKNNGVYK